MRYFGNLSNYKEFFFAFFTLVGALTLLRSISESLDDLEKLNNDMDTRLLVKYRRILWLLTTKVTILSQSFHMWVRSICDFNFCVNTNPGETPEVIILDPQILAIKETFILTAISAEIWSLSLFLDSSRNLSLIHISEPTRPY